MMNAHESPPITSLCWEKPLQSAAHTSSAPGADSSVLDDKQSGAPPVHCPESLAVPSSSAGARHCIIEADVEAEVVDSRGGDDEVVGRRGGARQSAFDYTGAGKTAFGFFRGASEHVKPLLSTNASSRALAETVSDTVGTGGEIPDDGHQRHRVRNPYQRFQVVVYCAFGITVALSAYQEVMLGVGISGCCRENSIIRKALSLSDEEECEGVFNMLITVPLLARQMLCFSACGYIFSTQLFAIHICRRMVAKGRQMTETNMPLSHVRIVSGHWTAVASPDILAEVTDMIAENQFLAVAISGTITIVATLALAPLEFLQGQQRGTVDSSPFKIQLRRLNAMCCAPGTEEWHPDHCSNACRVGALAHLPFLTFVMGIICCLICSVVFIPAKLWSPVTAEAEKTGQMPHYMRRMLRLPFVTFMLCGVNTVIFIIYIVEKAVIVSVPGFWTAVLYLDVATALAHLGAIMYIIHWKHLAKKVRQMVHYCLKWIREAANHSPAGAKLDSSHLRGSQHSRRYRQLVLGVCGFFAFSVGGSIGMAEGSASATELWIIRGIILLLMIFNRDAVADFNTLENKGAGFGLVLDARQLCRFLECHLAGKQYKGRVKRYKGTLLRMCDTMAVSYRWQGSTVTVNGLGAVNMRNWQMESLVKTIRSSGCLYVWLDAFSVPQTGHGELKRVLLSRMMAVYASSFVTLAMLSCEKETERYHQRVWTMQEYCSSGQLIVKQEPAEGGSSGKQAVHRKEAAIARQLRREHMARQPWCVPMWLHGDSTAVLDELPAQDSRRIYETYKALQDRLHCLYPEDSIRALYPLLWNCPAESQDELIRLMKLLELLHSIPHQVETNLLEQTSFRQLKLRFPCKRLTYQNTSSGDLEALVPFSSPDDSESDAGAE